MDVVKIVEVGPRDGLQNETRPIGVDIKLGLIERLAAAGLAHIEAASFVSPRWVPQMAGSDELMRRLPRAAGIHYSALTPNLKGLEAALAAGCKEVAVFGAASETFSQRNINCSIAESLQRFGAVAEHAQAHGMRVRGYVSCVLGCPYEGDVEPAQVAALARQMLDMGCHEVALGDTIGKGNPRTTRALLDACLRNILPAQLAGHFHDTFGMAIANISSALELGLRTFDSSVAGLGGCPYAPGASGNVPTEDVVYLMEGLGFPTGIDMKLLLDAGDYINAQLGRTPTSRVRQALRADCAAAG
ncbi:MAG TPA: hydroxymethylglutaryl-CoA lyase [Roseateles sp.]|uniref:hydroxymethylglutaryl-CoA lyase n=1 Tax=Roseateles sp. TaxID=1971397 RepID=UPI002EDA3AE2